MSMYKWPVLMPGCKILRRTNSANNVSVADDDALCDFQNKYIGERQ